jgi:predicted AlkP superfamily phosphohydrolase/phosphomutase
VRVGPSLKARFVAHVGSDHGHESVTEVIAVEKRLFDAGFKSTLHGPEIVVAPQGSAAFIHFGGDAASRRIEAADWLRQQSWVEDVFMGEDLAALGQMPGDDLIAIDMAKTEGCNINRVPGLTAMAARFDEETGESRRDCGVHGGRGRHETNPVLIATGEGFSEGQTISEETSITDIAPSIAHHLGISYQDFDGRRLQNDRN